MLVDVHQWSVVLLQGPKGSFMQFRHASGSTGVQVLDEIAWPLSPDARTEHQLLMELYQGVLDFIAARA